MADEIVEQITSKTARVWRSPSIVQLQNNLAVVLPQLQALSAEFYAYYIQQWASEDAVFPISEWGVCVRMLILIMLMTQTTQSSASGVRHPLV